ncbi:MAG: manganese efflux pump [Oscillospiraceae bacterium]|nr:manganese efflux pump [Oscillospiraceae bacterium]
MSFSLFAVVEALALAVFLSIDVLISAFAYGANRIKIPMLSAHIINFICSATIGLSFLVGTIIRPFLPPWLAVLISFGILFTIGLIKLADGLIKAYIRKNIDLSKEIAFSMFNLKFIISLYADPERADADDSKDLSPMEAVTLAFAVSMDGLALGLGAAFGNINGLLVCAWSLVTTMAAIILGCRLGQGAMKKLNFDASWLGGAALIILAVVKLV